VDNAITIDSFGPLASERPASVAELCALVKNIRAAKQGLYPTGGRTTLDFGLPPTKPGVACDITALNSVIDYPARDMTITVQAGITIAALQAELAKEGQWLPVDVPTPAHATLGGAVAVNASGPHRYGYGTLRDYVIGISFVTDDGVEVKAGGRVVKNVAGYDLMKLQIGAMGTLGVITQLTLKVRPKPEASAAVAFGCDSTSLGSVLDVLAKSKTRPVAVEILNQAALPAANITPNSSTDWTVLVGFEEKATAVRWQVAAILEELKSTAARDVTELPDTSFCTAVAQLQVHPESRFIGKLSVLPSKLAEAIAKPHPGIIHAHGLNGIAWLHEEPLPEGVIVRRCPPEIKKSRSVWGKPPSWELMRHVKMALDPDNIFNPGRLFGAL